MSPEYRLDAPIFPIRDCLDQKALLFKFRFSIKGDKQRLLEFVPLREFKERLNIIPHFSIDKGESDALALAGQTKNSVLATDDGKAIKACRYLKAPFIISPKIVIELFRLGKIDSARAKLAIEKLKIIGRYAPDIIAEALLELEVIKDVKDRNSQGS